MKARLTPYQQQIVDRIRSGDLRTVETGNREGNSVALLIRKGIVDARNRAWTPGETTYWGRRIPGCMWFGGLFIVGEETE